jgi:hypothetical protein
VMVSWMIIIALQPSAFSLQPKHLSSYLNRRFFSGDFS